MKVVGLITEYNPFHNGHAYHIKKAKELTRADAVVVVMSGNFVQRGLPAIISKYTRTRIALSYGADLVLELPAYFATGSAEYFASGAVALLDKLGVVDEICFGSECGSIELLTQIAKVLLEESDVYQNLLKGFLKSGHTFPFARSCALAGYLPSFLDHIDILNESNNILGVEYIKALLKRESNITPCTIARTGSSYHEHRLSTNHSSALAIRHSIEETNDLIYIRDQVPPRAHVILQEAFQKHFPVYRNDFSLILKYKLLSEASMGFTKYADVSEDLSERIINRLNEYTSYKDFCDLLKTKELTYSRISRALLHILLNVEANRLESYVGNDYICYARMLGFRLESERLLSAVKKESSIPLISKLSDAHKYLSIMGTEMLNEDILISHIYESVVADKFRTTMQNEYTQKIIRI